MEQPKFETESVREITEQAIKDALNDQVYDKNSVNKWSNTILQKTLGILSEKYPTYKYVSQCLILKKPGGGLHTSNSCFWDRTSDGVVTVQWENESMHSIVSIYGFAVP